MGTFDVMQHSYDDNFLPRLDLLGGKYTLDIDMNDEDKLYQVVLTRWEKPYDMESEEEQSGDYVILSNPGEKDNYKESLASFVKYAWRINDDTVEEIFQQHYKRKTLNQEDAEQFDLAVDRAVSNGLIETIGGGGGFIPTKKALKLVGLKTFKGLSQETAMKKITEILNLPENKEYGKESRAIRYTYAPIGDDNGKTFYGIYINGRPSPERISFDTEAEAKEYIKDRTTNFI